MTSLAPEEKRMQAGRELDALVHERVMGGKQVWRVIRKVSGDIRELSRTIPRYSTDISAAWTVVEKMQAAGWDFVLDIKGTACVAQFYKPDSTSESNEWCEGLDANGENNGSASHSICLAALRAVSGESPL